MKYLSLWFESPLQSWGVDSKFGLRTTFSFPTKSGIAGIILASMGKGGEEKDFLENFSFWKEYAFSFSPDNESGSSLHTDFHMIGNGYDSSDIWQCMMIPRMRDGDIPNTGGSKITVRQYLQGVYFGVVLEIPNSYYDINDIVSSLQNPMWPIYLGRKCCVPSYPIFQGLFDSYDEAKEPINKIAEGKKLILKETMEDGAEYYKGDVLCINDVPVKFGGDKIYRDRFVTIIKE